MKQNFHLSDCPNFRNHLSLLFCYPFKLAMNGRGKVSIENLFFEVFSDLPFPYSAIDLGKLNKAISRNEGKHDRTHVAMGLNVPPEKRHLLAACWRGFLKNANVPHFFTATISRELPLSKSGNGRTLLKQSNPYTSPRSSIKVVENRILWEQDSYWPAAFSTMLGQLNMLVAVFCLHIEKHHEETGKIIEDKGFDKSAVEFRSEFPRLLPTRQQYAFASLGAWLGGTTNLQYLGYYATIRQIHHRDLNRKYLDRIGFDDATVTAMDTSGLIAVPATLLAPLIEAQGSALVFGSLPIDEQNFANPPAVPFLEFFQNDPDAAMSGVLVDKYYRSPFWARKLEPHGLYGRANVLRDHYDSFYANIQPAELLRCKHYCVPVIEVSSLDEIRKYVAQIPIRHDMGIFFRGQTTLHTLQRDDGVRKLLFADSCSVEPSLTTSAARDVTYDYDVVHYILRQFAEQHLYSSEQKLISMRAERWREEASSPQCRLDYAIMALAQHYGLPSHGLDVTDSDDVAVWFATNRFNKDPETGIAKYNKILAFDWADDPCKWPIIFACQIVTNSIESSLMDCQELEEFGILAKRPACQRAKFFHGGHSDHQNRLAETVVCAFRLRPNLYETTSTFDSLFPPPEEDPAYEFMLNFANRRATPWMHHINRFHAAPDRQS